MDKQKRNRLNLFLKLVMALMFLAGFLVFIYPFVVDAVNNYVDQRRITALQESMQKRNENEAKERAQKMQEENEKQKTKIPGAGSFDDPFEAALTDTKSPAKEYYEKHTIGAIFIPKIKISLPIYDQTNKILLEKGATVLQGTSFPVGGKNTHSVITGHTGLADKKLFTDLDELKKADVFFLHIENIKLAYQINQIKVVEPNDLSDLKIQPNKDLVTLLTCTPYGINSHRLLLTADRISYPKEAAKKEIKKVQTYHKRRLVLLIIACGVFLMAFAYFVWRKIVLYRAKKRTYDLIFYLHDQGQPLTGLKVGLVSRWKQRPVKVDGKKLEAVSDQEGKVIFTQIPGELYRLMFAGAPKVTAKIWRVKDMQFHLYSRRRYLRKFRGESTVIDRSGEHGKNT